MENLATVGQSDTSKRGNVRRLLASTLSSRWTLPTAVLFVAVLRVLLLAVTGRQEHFSDESDYWSIADSLTQGRGFSLFGHLTAYRPPAMPYLLAAGMMLAGKHYWIFAGLNSLLLCLLPFLIVRIARKVGLSRCYACVAGIIVTLHPGLNYAAITIYPTVVTAIGIAIATLLALEAIDNQSVLFASLSGLSGGIAASATTIFGPYGAILALVALVKRRYKIAIWTLLFSLVPTVAWIARNHVQMHTYALATNSGFNMELGANDQAEARSGNLISPEITPQEPVGGEISWDQDHHRRAIVWIRAHKIRYAVLFFSRCAAVFDSVGKPATKGLHNSNIAKLVGWMMLPMVLSGLAGLMLSYRTPLAWMTAGALLLVVVSSGITIVKPRFRFPCDPLLIIFSVVTIQRVVNVKTIRI